MKKRNSSIKNEIIVKKVKQRKMINKNSFYDADFSLSEQNSDIENYSVFEDIFDYKMFPNFNIRQEDLEKDNEPVAPNERGG